MTNQGKDYALTVEQIVNGLRIEIKKHFMPDHSCLTCDHFREDLETCQHSNHCGVRPPVRVIVYGCALHMNSSEDIPF